MFSVQSCVWKRNDDHQRVQTHRFRTVADRRQENVLQAGHPAREARPVRGRPRGDQEVHQGGVREDRRHRVREMELRF